MPVQNLRNTFALHYNNIKHFLHQIRFETVCEIFFKTCLPPSFRQWLTFSLAGDWLRGPGALITNYQSYLHFIISEPHTPDCPSDRLGVIECDNPNSQSTNIKEWQLTQGAHNTLDFNAFLNKQRLFNFAPNWLHWVWLMVGSMRLGDGHKLRTRRY